MAGKRKYATLEEAQRVNNERSKQWYYKNKEQVLEKQRKKYAENKANEIKLAEAEKRIHELELELELLKLRGEKHGNE